MAMNTMVVTVSDITAPISVQPRRNILTNTHGLDLEKGRLTNHMAKRLEKPVTRSPSLIPKQDIMKITSQLPQELANTSEGVITLRSAKSATHSMLT